MAKGEVNGKNETRYPCRKYKNPYIYELDIVELHFRRDGFAFNYKRWIFHEEEIGHGKGNAGGNLHAEADEDDEDDSEDEDEDENEPTANHSLVPMSFNNVLKHLVGHGSRDFSRLLEKAYSPLYPGSTNKLALDSLPKLMHLKVSHGWNDESFDMLLQLVNSVFPAGTKFPASYHDA